MVSLVLLGGHGPLPEVPYVGHTHLAARGRDAGNARPMSESECSAETAKSNTDPGLPNHGSEPYREADAETVCR